MKKFLFTTALFVLVGLFSVAQKLVLNSIAVKEINVFNSYRDTTFNLYTLDSQGYKQGPFSYTYKSKILTKGTYKNNVLVDSCFWFNTEGDLFAKGRFTYQNDYTKTVGFSMVDYSKNYFAYLNDTLLVYNHPDDQTKPSVLVYKNNLKDGVLYINSKDGFENVFTYKQDTLHGYFKNAFLSNANTLSKYDKETFVETGTHWHGEKRYDGWYYKYQIDNADTTLIQKTLYDKNIKILHSTFYKTSGAPECIYYYSKAGLIDSIRCSHEEGRLKSIIHYQSTGDGLQYTYDQEGQLIKKASYNRECLHGYVFEYTGNEIETKELYKNDTILARERYQNNLIWQRVLYKNNEVEKVEWITNKGVVKYTTCCESVGTGDSNLLTTQVSNSHSKISSAYASGKDAPLTTEDMAEKRADLLLFKTFPVGHKLYSKYYFNYSNTFVISKREKNSFRPNGYYNYTLIPIQDSLTSFSNTKEGELIRKLKSPVHIVVSLSLLASDSKKGFTEIHLKEIVDEEKNNKKVNKAINKFFSNRTIPFLINYYENQYVECSYTIYPK